MMTDLWLLTGEWWWLMIDDIADADDISDADTADEQMGRWADAQMGRLADRADV